MAVYEITFSPTGGTDKVTELLTEAMDGEKRRISLLPEKEDYSRHVFKSGDICFIAVPSFGGRVPQEAAKGLECERKSGPGGSGMRLRKQGV